MHSGAVFRLAERELSFPGETVKTFDRHDPCHSYGFSGLSVYRAGRLQDGAYAAGGDDLVSDHL